MIQNACTPPKSKMHNIHDCAWFCIDIYVGCLHVRPIILSLGWIQFAFKDCLCFIITFDWLSHLKNSRQVFLLQWRRRFKSGCFRHMSFLAWQAVSTNTNDYKSTAVKNEMEGRWQLLKRQLCSYVPCRKFPAMPLTSVIRDFVSLSKLWLTCRLISEHLHT